MFPTFESALADLTTYFYTFYHRMTYGTPWTYNIPRNISFLLHCLFKKRISIDRDIVKSYQYSTGGTFTELSPDKMTSISKLIASEYLNYDYVTCISQDSKPFISSRVDVKDGQTGHHFHKYTISGLSTCYWWYYDGTPDAPTYASFSNMAENDSYFPIAAMLSEHTAGTVADGASMLFPNYAIQPGLLRQYVAYSDNIFDEAYALTTSVDPTHTFESYADEFTKTISYYNVTDEFKTYWSDVANITNLDSVVHFARHVYAPFLSVPVPTTKEAIISFAIVAQFRGPLYIPAVVHECIVGNRDAFAVSIKKPHGLWRGRIFHYSNPTSIVWDEDTVELMSNISHTLLNTRMFAKLNSVPETQPSKAFIPHFFMTSPDDGATSESYFTPYNTEYIDHHNLITLATNLWWPTLNTVSPMVLSSLSRPAVLPISIKIQSLYMISFIFDFAYRADGAEIDHYLYKVRISYIGLFGFLKGLASKVGGAVKGVATHVVKPLLSNPAVQSITHMAAAAIGGPGAARLVDAGVSMLTQDNPGQPSNTSNLDLSQA